MNKSRILICDNILVVYYVYETIYFFTISYFRVLLLVLSRYPSLKTIRELLYKHGHGSVSGRRTPLTSNADIEKALGTLMKLWF